MTVVGIGAQDDLAFAQDFVERTGTTFTMLWSDSSESWSHFGVRRNSTVLLLDRSGNVVEGSAGSYDPDSLIEQLATLTGA